MLGISSAELTLSAQKHKQHHKQKPFWIQTHKKCLGKIQLKTRINIYFSAENTISFFRSVLNADAAAAPEELDLVAKFFF
jgi:hypothetical protein